MNSGASEGQSEEVEEKPSLAFGGSTDAAELTADGKFRCLDCGMLFETLEEHDLHVRRAHCAEELCSFSGALL